jgi:hypothetical protein
MEIEKRGGIADRLRHRPLPGREALTQRGRPHSGRGVEGIRPVTGPAVRQLNSKRDGPVDTA